MDCTTSTGWTKWLHEARIEFLRITTNASRSTGPSRAWMPIMSSMANSSYLSGRGTRRLTRSVSARLSGSSCKIAARPAIDSLTPCINGASWEPVKSIAPRHAVCGRCGTGYSPGAVAHAESHQTGPEAGVPQAGREGRSARDPERPDPRAKRTGHAGTASAAAWSFQRGADPSRPLRESFELPSESYLARFGGITS